jgi:hypothetical protein
MRCITCIKLWYSVVVLAVTSPEGMCDDECGCCENDALWSSPVVAGWEPECMYCGRKAVLVRVLE